MGSRLLNEFSFLANMSAPELARHLGADLGNALVLYGIGNVLRVANQSANSFIMTHRFISPITFRFEAGRLNGGIPFDQVGLRKPFVNSAQGSRASSSWSQGTSYQAAQLKIDLQQQTCRSLFTRDGKLTKSAIENADVLLKVEKFDQRSPIFKELSRRGNIGDWFKYKTKKFHSPGVDVGLKQTNPLAEVHFYKNANTGEVYYGMDFKVKFDVAGQPQMTVQDFLNSLPKKWRPTF